MPRADNETNETILIQSPIQQLPCRRDHLAHTVLQRRLGIKHRQSKQRNTPGHGEGDAVLATQKRCGNAGNVCRPIKASSGPRAVCKETRPLAFAHASSMSARGQRTLLRTDDDGRLLTERDKVVHGDGVACLHPQVYRPPGDCGGHQTNACSAARVRARQLAKSVCNEAGTRHPARRIAACRPLRARHYQ